MSAAPRGRFQDVLVPVLQIAARLPVFSHPGLPQPIAVDSVHHTWSSYSETLERMVLSAETTRCLSVVEGPVQLVTGDRGSVVDRGSPRSVTSSHERELTEWHGRHDVPLIHAHQCVEVIAACQPPLRNQRAAGVVQPS